MSSANLDKTLDDIIKAKPKAPRRQLGIKKSGAKAVVAKKKAKKPDVKAPKAKEAPRSNTGKGGDVAEVAKLATRITISNLPTDITEASVKDYLAKEIGPISKCLGSYNASGKPLGIFTITFRNEGSALDAMNRLNGTPIDNGSRKMKVEIMYDPTKKPLASRLTIRSSKNTKADAPVKTKARAPGAKKTAEKDAGSGSSNKKKRATTRRSARPAKSAEELDAEMVDYFAGKDAAVAEIEI